MNDKTDRNMNKGYELRCKVVDYLVKELKFDDYDGTSTPYHIGMSDEEHYAMVTFDDNNFAICVRANETTKRSYDEQLLKVMNNEEVPNLNINTNEHIDKIDIFAILHELGHRYYNLTKTYDNDYEKSVINLQVAYNRDLISKNDYHSSYRQIPQERDADLFACEMMKNKTFMKKLCKYINKQK